MMKVDTTRTGSVLVLAVTGEVDLDTADTLREAVLACFDDDATEVRVDLAEVIFLNSSGLNALLAGANEARSKNVAYSVSHPQPQVRKVMDMVGLSDVLGVRG